MIDMGKIAENSEEDKHRRLFLGDEKDLFWSY